MTTTIPPHLAPIAGRSFGSFAELADAMHECDVRRATNLRRTSAMRRANRERGR